MGKKIFKNLIKEFYQQPSAYVEDMTNDDSHWDVIKVGDFHFFFCQMEDGVGNGVG